MTNAEIAKHAAATQRWAEWLVTNTPVLAPLPSSQQGELKRARNAAVSALDALGEYPGLVYYPSCGRSFAQRDVDYYTFEG